MAAVAATVVAGATAAYMNKKASDKATAAGNRAANSSLALQQQQFDQYQQNITPWLNAGNDALNQMNALNSGDFSQFHESPDYQFAFNQGMQGLDRSAAARGGLYSGGADADRIAYGQGMASQQFNSFYNKLQNLAQMGQGAANSLGSAGQNNANAMANIYGQQAQNQANGAYGTANAWGQLANTAAGGIGAYYGSRQSSYAQPQTAQTTPAITNYANTWGAFNPNQPGWA